MSAVLTVLCMVGLTASAAEPLQIGSRRELFVDGYLVDRLMNARQVLHAPQPRETVLRLGEPWEGVYSGYFTVLHDGGKFRMYYRGMPEARHDFDTEVTCYAESRDGIQWTKPALRLFEVRGRMDNNVILARHRACHNFSPFLDTNPDVKESERFKALGGTGKPGLVALVSPDGIHWRDLQADPVITEGAFDSQNVSFWSESEQRYVCYFRIFENGVRWISRTSSTDFVHWTDPVMMEVGDQPMEHLYTNQTSPYFRAPQIYLGMPTRFLPGRKVLSDERTAAIGTALGFDFRNDCADIILSSTRGGADFPRTFMEAFIRPGLDLKNWTSRANYAAHGFLQTGPEELSVYVNHNVGYASSHIQRYTLRLDGFASVQGPYTGGELLTPPLVFEGRRLAINHSTSAAGGIRVELQDTAGTAIPGFGLGECVEVIGDEIERVVGWTGGSDVGGLAGRPVRLRIELKDADLFSLRFVP
jgi:hypothetical protein